MNLEKIKKINEMAEKYKDYTAKNLSEIVKIKGTSLQEKEVVLKLKEQCVNAGFDEVRIDGLGSLVAKIGTGSKILAIDAHIDTVDTGDISLWDKDPFSGDIDDKYVYGRGTVDQLGGAASMITAGRILKELKFDSDYTIYFTFTVMEEDCDGLCWNYLIEKEKLVPDFAIITEPTNLNIYRGHRGRMEIEMHFKGFSCHGSAPERGVNAIYKASRAALEVEKLHERLKKDEFLGKGSVTATLIKSDSPSLCAVADYAMIHLDRRLTYGETKESAIAEIEAIVPKDTEVKVAMYSETSYTGTVYPVEKYYPTWKIEENHFLVKQGVEVYENLFNSKPFVDKWTFSTNGVAICGKYKIPCIGFGPGNEVLAHAPNEKTEINHLVKASAFYAGFVI